MKLYVSIVCNAALFLNFLWTQFGKILRETHLSLSEKNGTCCQSMWRCWSSNNRAVYLCSEEKKQLSYLCLSTPRTKKDSTFLVAFRVNFIFFASNYFFTNYSNNFFLFFVAFLRKQQKKFRVRLQDGIIVPVFLL